MAMASIDDSWSRIHEWIDDKSPQMRQLLEPGVSSSVINKMKEDIEVNVLPEAFTRSYNIHNGSTATSFFGANMPFSFYCIDEIVEEWKDLRDTHAPEHDNDVIEREEVENPEIKNLIWSERWIPFGGDPQGNCICVDMDPAETGTLGQIIYWFNSDDSPTLCATSFENYMNDFADDMEKGKYSLSQDGTHLIYRELDNDP